MNQFSLGYREVNIDHDTNDKWIEINLRTGGSQTILQDVQTVDIAHGYSYKNCENLFTRNRFIYWKISADTIELTEHSLDLNLEGNKLRFRFTDSLIIDGVTITERHDDDVVILVPTISSVHRFVFPHPLKFHKQNVQNRVCDVPSIFAKANFNDAKNPNSFYVFSCPNSVVDLLPSLGASYYQELKNEAFFLIGYPTGELLFIKLNDSGQVSCQELTDDSTAAAMAMPKFLTGLTGKFQKQKQQLNSLAVLIDSFEYLLSLITLECNGYLKFWTMDTGSTPQCVCAVDLFGEIRYTGTDRLKYAKLRKTADDLGNLAIYLKFGEESRILICKILPISDATQPKIKLLHNLTSLHLDLLDFAVNNKRIWTIWRLPNNNCDIYTNLIGTGGGWVKVLLDKRVECEVPHKVAADKYDSRQFYLDQLFYSGRFPLHIVSQALGIYKKSFQIGIQHIDLKFTSVAALKQAISLTIEAEVKSTASDSNDTNSGEYLGITAWCWGKFFLSCTQYYESTICPIGFLLLPLAQSAVILKRNTVSFIRPMEMVEHLSVNCQSLTGHEHSNVVDEMSRMMFNILNFIDKQLSDSFKENFEKLIGECQNPYQAVRQLIDNLTDDDSVDIKAIRDYLDGQLSSIDLYETINKILDWLRYDVSDSDMETSSSCQLFSSNIGVSVVAVSLRQQCENRMSICRNLLVLIELSLVKVNVKLHHALKSICRPEVVYLIKAYYVVLWLTRLPALNNSPAMEQTLQRLSMIKLRNSTQKSQNNANFTLLELFIIDELESVNFDKKCLNPSWHFSLLTCVNKIKRLMWPIIPSTVLPEWLICSGQHVWLQHYVKLLSDWCDTNVHTACFLLGVSFLTSAENFKALSMFTAALNGLNTEPFLKKLGGYDQPDAVASNNSFAHVQMRYYLKIIQLFELHRARDCILEICNVAIVTLVNSDGHTKMLATMYSIKFKHQLALKHFDDAFNTLRANPDRERRFDGLREFIKMLLDERQYDVLLSNVYGDLEELFSNILLTRARSCDVVNESTNQMHHNPYYRLLFAYHIKRGPLNFRLAAQAQYEYALRLTQTRSKDLNILEERLRCLLITKTALDLVDQPEYAWLIKPNLLPDLDNREIYLEAKAGSGQTGRKLSIKRQIDVITITSLHKEIVFLTTKLKLAHFDRSISNNINNSLELVTFLNSAGLYKDSLKLCEIFHFSFVTTIESLTVRCIILSETEDANSWNWLTENDLQDLSPNRNKPSILAWELLRRYLEKYEDPQSSELHRAAVKKIIDLGVYLPFWLILSYKLKNPNELLKLLYQNGRLEEAFDLARDLLLAALGPGGEQFGFKLALTATACKQFCLPVNVIQNLVQEFRLQNELEGNFREEFLLLSELFEKYLLTAVRISNQKCQLELSTFGSIKI